MEQRNRENDYINLAEVFNAIVQNIGIIILSGIVCGLLGFIYSAFFVTPLYSASAMMIVNSGERYDYVTQDQLNSATTLVDTYSVIITSDTVMDDVRNHLQFKDEKEFASVVKHVNVASVNETQIMKVTVIATNPETAFDVCAEITNVAPDVIVNTVKAGSVETVSKAKTNWKPVSPNVKRNTLLSIIGGFVLMALIIGILSILDNKISGENDITQANLQILGVIPFYDLED